MPLSDHEQRLLEQMERALYQEDPKFASSLRKGRGGPVNRMRVAAGIGVVLLGLLGVLVGVASGIAAIGAVGFAAMVGGGFWSWSGFGSGESPAEEAPQQPKATTPKPSGDFMDKMEERWKKRREQDEPPH